MELESEFHTLDWTNGLLQSVYCARNGNILIRNNNSANNLCYIYFSSNDLYIKDNKEDFLDKIVQDNRFEWTNRSAVVKPKKEIFLRDIWLSWYTLGVNSEINSVDKMIEYLKQETNGFEIVTVGVSSGGYIAAIIAVTLNATMCFDFSGQFSLANHFDHIEKNPFLHEYVKNHFGGGDILKAINC